MGCSTAGLSDSVSARPGYEEAGCASEAASSAVDRYLYMANSLAVVGRDISIDSRRDLVMKYQRMGLDLYSRNQNGGDKRLNVRGKLNDVQNPRT